MAVLLDKNKKIGGINVNKQLEFQMPVIDEEKDKGFSRRSI